MEGKKLLFVVNVDSFMVSHRLPIAIAAIAAGWEVHIACALTSQLDVLKKHGLIVHELPFSRRGTNLYEEGKVFLSLFKLMRRIRPDVVHLITIKPVLYGGVIARLCRLPAVVVSISGLGYVFIANGFKAKLRRSLVLLGYRLALAHKRISVIFQNNDDKNTLANIVLNENSILIKGSGVDLDEYNYVPEPCDVPVVMLLARLLRDKGVVEFVSAAEILKKKGIKARFLLVGDSDANPTSIQPAEIRNWVDLGIVEWLGHRSDVIELLKNSNLVVLPSYREGLPKALIEAAACGRAVVTTDVPGCRDAIDAGVTGLLIPVKNVMELASAMEKLLINADLRQQMGRNGRNFAERTFSIDSVVNIHLNIYSSIISL